MIDTTLITINECINDGSVVHLYYNDKCDTWIAYGVSAYMLCHIGVEPMSIVYAYSDEMQMPFAEVDKEAMKKLFRTHSVERGKEDKVQLELCLSEPINFDNYLGWTKRVKNM